MAQRSELLPYDVGAFGPGKILDLIDPDSLDAAWSVGAREFTFSAEAPRSLGTLDLLRDYDQMLGLRLLPRRRLTKGDWEIVSGLRCLRYLQLLHGQVSGRLDVSGLPDLEWFVGPWWKGLNLEGAPLRGLSLEKFSGDHLRVDPRLEALVLSRPRMSTLSSISHLSGLRSLVLHQARGLESLEGLQNLPLLEEISIEGMGKVTDMSALGRCANMTRIGIVDCPNVAKLALGSIEAIWLTGTTCVPRKALQEIATMTSLRHAVLRQMPDSPIDVDAAPRLSGGYPSIPAYAFREPAVRPYAALSALPYARDWHYPEWFQAAHPELYV